MAAPEGDLLPGNGKAFSHSALKALEAGRHLVRIHFDEVDRPFEGFVAAEVPEFDDGVSLQ